MRTLGKIAATLGVVGAIATSSTSSPLWLPSLLPSSLLRLLSSPPSSPSLVSVLKGKIFEAASTGGLLFHMIDPTRLIFGSAIGPTQQKEIALGH